VSGVEDADMLSVADIRHAEEECSCFDTGVHKMGAGR